ncbi:MAG TPA: response regulator, partial [Candidatus Kapabacteria bacterium]|nr:response regulator [Candidatus Kapabacteria bacterium]
AITRRLTEMMGGKITVQSEEGKGTIFQVALKDIEISAHLGKTKEPENISSPLDVNNIMLGKATILVVDDKVFNRGLLAKFLDYPGITIIEAENGLEAVEMVKQFRPDLVLMDVVMPVMDGYEATLLLKADEQLKSIPVIAVTASAMKEQEIEIRKSGSDGYLKKPVSKIELMSQVIRFLPYTTKGTGSLVTAEAVNPGTAAPIVETHIPGFFEPGIKQKLSSLADTLQGDLTRQWERVSKTFLLDEIEDFSIRTRELGDRYGLKMLEDWGNRLLKVVQSYDMQKVTQTLTYFPTLIAEIKAFVATEPENGRHIQEEQKNGKSSIPGAK